MGFKHLDDMFYCMLLAKELLAEEITQLARGIWSYSTWTYIVIIVVISIMINIQYHYHIIIIVNDEDELDNKRIRISIMLEEKRGEEKRRKSEFGNKEIKRMVLPFKYIIFLSIVYPLIYI